MIKSMDDMFIILASYSYSSKNHDDLILLIILILLFIFGIVGFLIHHISKSLKSKSESKQELFQTHKSYSRVNESDHLINTKNWLDFEEKNRIVIEKHINKFENPLNLVCQYDDIDKKIELLQIAITEYEKQKEWFYSSTGGRKYFKLYFENLHNSHSANFEYIDQAKWRLNYYRDCQDIIIPKIIELASSPEGVLQKDMYVHFDDNDKNDIREMVKYLEKKGKINKVKKGNSYLITLK